MRVTLFTPAASQSFSRSFNALHKVSSGTLEVTLSSVSHDFDLRNFSVQAQPNTEIQGLRRGMRALGDWPAISVDQTGAAPKDITGAVQLQIVLAFGYTFLAALILWLSRAQHRHPA